MEPVKYVKMDPNKNATILVINEYSRKEYSFIANKLMRPQSVYAEQVGFLEKPTIPLACCRLHMMGGEFCANAAASVGAYLAYTQDMRATEETAFRLEVSGSEELIECRVQKQKEGYGVQITMPLPIQIRKTVVTYKDQKIEICFVEYDDISHAIIFVECYNQQSKTLARHVLHQEMEKKHSSRGVTLFSEQSSNIWPLIYVEKTDTEIWESSCGIASATAAVCMAHKQAKDTSIKIVQPSGDCIEAHAAYYNGMIRKVTIEEEVLLSSIGTAFI